MTSTVVAIDVGNTRVKWGIFPPSGEPTFGAVPAQQFSADVVAFPSPPVSVAVSTVGAAGEKVIADLERAGFPPKVLLKSDGTIFSRCFAKSGVETPETTGID